MNKLADFYYLWGNEHYLIDQEINKIAADFELSSGESPEISFLEADELTPGQLLEALDFSSLFNLSRILIIKRPSWLGKSRKKKSRSEEYFQVLEGYFNQPAQGQIVIITGEELPTGPFGKTLGKAARVMHFTKPDAAALNGWLQEEFRKREKQVSPGVIKLVSSSAQDMYYLKNLIDKLCLMHPDETISINDVEEELSSGEEVRIFKLSDALLRKDLGAALASYNQLMSQGGSEVFFLYIVVQQFVQMARVKSCRDEKMSNKEIENSLGLKGWAVKTKSEQSGRFNWEDIRNLFDVFLETDIRLKTTSQIPKLVFEELMVKVCSSN